MCVYVCVCECVCVCVCVYSGVSDHFTSVQLAPNSPYKGQFHKDRLMNKEKFETKRNTNKLRQGYVHVDQKRNNIYICNDKLVTSELRGVNVSDGIA